MSQSTEVAGVVTLFFGIPTIWIASELIPFLFALIVWAIAIVILRFTKKTHPVFLTLFTLFFFYIYAVLNLTLFQFQALLILKSFIPSLVLKGLAAGEDFNPIPLISLTLDDLKTSLLNILMMIPFGLGLPFISRAKCIRVVTLGFLVSFGIELMQLISSRLAGIAFRVTDINDLIFNTFGVAIGYYLFSVGFRLLESSLVGKRIQRNIVVEYVLNLRKPSEVSKQSLG